MDEETVSLGLGVKRCKLSLKGKRNSSKLCITGFTDECLSEINLLNKSPERPLETLSNINLPATENSELGENPDCEKIQNELEHLVTLPNIGNTCFMNSVLHVLRITPNFIPWLHRTVIEVSGRTENSELFILHKIYQILRELEDEKSSEPNEKEELETHLQSLLNIFANQNREFSAGQQFDAHEFLGWLVTLFQKPPYKNKRSASNGFVTSIIEGRAKNVVFCNECETSTAQEDNFWDLKVPLLSIYELEENDVRASFNANTVLCGEDKYSCNTCLQLTEARHSLRILELPAILIVHIPSKWQNTEKCVPFKVAETLCCIKDNCQINCHEQKHSFRLYAMVIHIGSSSKFGHYVTLMRPPCEVPSTSNFAGKRYCTRSHQMIWEDCCQMSGLKFISNKWVLCDDDKIVFLTSASEYFETFTSGSSARPSVLWYQRQS